MVHGRVLAGLALVGLGLAAQADTASIVDAQAAYAVPHAMVDIDHGRRLNLYCAGSGTPRVIFEAGSGLAAWDWWRVHPAIAARTQACVYDRAGLGFSDPATRPGTSANAVDDLHRLLGAAGIAPPYVLVGHSSGGMDVQLYAYAHPTEVAGLVLVDASHEDETGQLDRITGGKYSALMAGQLAGGEQCRAQAHRGFEPGTDAFAECVGSPPALFATPLAAAWLSRQLRADVWDASASEVANQAVSDAELRRARGSFGDKPLVYLTHGISPFLQPGRPQSAVNKATEVEFVRLHETVAALSSHGVQRVVPGAAHFIHVDRPQAVIAAILDVISQVPEDARR